MNPLVSIITTFYNSVSLGNFVEAAMDSLLSQTYKNIEFICVNDGSTDETLKQLQLFQKKDSRIQIIDKENEGTAQYAKAAGQDSVKGDYIMLFDHDDGISSEAVESAIAVFRNRPELDMVGFIVKTMQTNGDVKSIYSLDNRLENISEYKSINITGAQALQKTIGNYDFYFRGLYRQDIFNKHSFRFTERLLNADEIVERQILQHVTKIGSCTGIYTHYIYNNSSAKSFNLKKIDIVVSDIYLRQFAIKFDLYENRKQNFEIVAYKNFVNSVKILQHFKASLSPEKLKFYDERLRNSYNALNRKFILKNYSGLSRLYNQILLSNYTLINYFYKIKK